MMTRLARMRCSFAELKITKYFRWPSVRAKIRRYGRSVWI
jgi:hypothetical protein